ncbi:AGE family epimerase/isomerase [Hyphomonas sp. WL0036]|uniref:AGE family epimerase/isomerase n=1 Tax=Hyphomonas sediminis TaxID=2866160 RepID=UPI001C808DB1|nr:AGE family epimerase/isomerase [Hyphomonas sediminis]MBY9068529.1 AGE family epimerase/isomerase [Hyphomonas sediminis]
MTQVLPVILCGGSGTRLWPLSTPNKPKQFLGLLSSETMLSATARRFESSLGSTRFSKPAVIGSVRHESLIRQSLPTARLVLEPFGRNSAPAVAAACLVAGEGAQLVLILPADHDIRDTRAFHAAIDAAIPAAQSGALVTFGISPTHPATGYGYINLGPGDVVHEVRRFVEKPDAETARGYLAEGNYVWNAGIFLFRADYMIKALEQHAPAILPAVRAAFPAKPGQVVQLDSDAFATAPDISIDHAVLEHADNIRVVPVDMGWSDVGGYRALFDQLAPEPSGNVAVGPVHIRESSGIYARSEGPALAVSGVSDLTIVATPDTVLILPMGDETSVKAMGELVQRRRDLMTVSRESQLRAHSWLQSAFRTWSNVSWDHARGGFVEQLNPDGSPDFAALRRTRVQARQIFSFSRALSLGLVEPKAARTLIHDGLAYLNAHARHPEGGFVHRLTPDGQAEDSCRDLYDHAFVILAASEAYKVLGQPGYLDLAWEALAFINRQLRAAEGMGWHEAYPISLPRRSNPHMHLLEALLNLHAATGDANALSSADEIVNLFESRFFLTDVDVLGEAFDTGLYPVQRHSEMHFEPGHHYEWASLLALYDRLRHRDTLSWRRRLIRKADLVGCHPQSGLAMNEVRADGMALNMRHRVWHQLERLRAVILHTEVSFPGAPDQILAAIFKYYLDGMPEGTWRDEVDTSGQPTRQEIPASILYHFITAFEMLIEPGLPGSFKTAPTTQGQVPATA